MLRRGVLRGGLYLSPDLTRLWGVSVLGGALCVLGECVRKLAMYTAKKNFNHVIQVVT